MKNESIRYFQININIVILYKMNINIMHDFVLIGLRDYPSPGRSSLKALIHLCDRVKKYTNPLELSLVPHGGYANVFDFREQA